MALADFEPRSFLAPRDPNLKSDLPPGVTREMQEANPVWQAEQAATQGFTPAEMAEALQSIAGAAGEARGRTARLMTRGGGGFDPAAFARASAPIAGGTQRAIGGLHAASARLKRENLYKWLQYISQQRQQQQQQQTGLFGGIGSLVGSLIGLGGGGRRGAGGGVAGGIGSPNIQSF